jgi:23S rRNA (adenine2503-C2)-methyltransferase
MAVSIGSAVPSRRAELMPIDRRHGLDELAEALRAVHASQQTRQLVSLTLLGGYNTDAEEAQAIGRWLAGIPSRLTLIDVAPGPHHPFLPPSPAELDDFLGAFKPFGVPFTRRLSGGADIDAACGMLAGRLSR